MLVFLKPRLILFFLLIFIWSMIITFVITSACCVCFFSELWHYPMMIFLVFNVSAENEEKPELPALSVGKRKHSTVDSEVAAEVPVKKEKKSKKEKKKKKDAIEAGEVPKVKKKKHKKEKDLPEDRAVMPEERTVKTEDQTVMPLTLVSAPASLVTIPTPHPVCVPAPVEVRPEVRKAEKKAKKKKKKSEKVSIQFPTWKLSCLPVALYLLLYFTMIGWRSGGDIFILMVPCTRMCSMTSTIEHALAWWHGVFFSSTVFFFLFTRQKRK